MSDSQEWWVSPFEAPPSFVNCLILCKSEWSLSHHASPGRENATLPLLSHMVWLLSWCSTLFNPLSCAPANGRWARGCRCRQLAKPARSRKPVSNSNTRRGMTGWVARQLKLQRERHLDERGELQQICYSDCQKSTWKCGHREINLRAGRLALAQVHHSFPIPEAMSEACGSSGNGVIRLKATLNMPNWS